MTQAVVAAGEYSLKFSKLSPEEAIPQDLTADLQSRTKSAFGSARPFTENQRAAYFRTKQAAETKRIEIREKEHLLRLIGSPEFGEALDEILQQAKGEEIVRVHPKASITAPQQIIEAVVTTEPPADQKEKLKSKPILFIDETIHELFINGKIIELTNEEYNGLLELADYVDEPVSNRRLKEVMFDAPYPELKRVDAIIEGLQGKLEAASNAQGLVQAEKKPRSALYTLTNCEIQFKEEEEEGLPPSQPGVISKDDSIESVKKPDLKFDISVEDGQFVVAGKRIVLNKTERQILETLLKSEARKPIGSLNQEIFSSAPMDAKTFRETLHALKATLRRVTGTEVLSITRGSNGGVELKGLQFVKSVENQAAPTSQPVETAPKPTTPETSQNELGEKDRPILGTLIRKYNGVEFSLANGQQVTLNVSEEALNTCEGLSRTANSKILTGLEKQPGEYLRLRKNLLRKLSSLLSDPGFETLIGKYPEPTKILLEELYLTPGIRNILSQLASLSGDVAVSNEREYLTKPWLGVPEMRFNSENFKNGSSGENNEESVINELKKTDKAEDEGRRLPVGQIVMKEGTGRIEAYTKWRDEDILKFILRGLPKADSSNSSIVEAFWKMVRHAQINPDDPKFKVKGAPQLRSIAPHEVPGASLGMGESGRTRLVYRVYNAKGQKLVTLEGVFRDHKAYETFLDKG